MGRNKKLIKIYIMSTEVDIFQRSAFLLIVIAAVVCGEKMMHKSLDIFDLSIAA